MFNEILLQKTHIFFLFWEMHLLSWLNYFTAGKSWSANVGQSDHEKYSLCLFCHYIFKIVSVSADQLAIFFYVYMALKEKIGVVSLPSNTVFLQNCIYIHLVYYYGR